MQALDGGDLRASDLRGARLGLRELAGVTVEAGQLLDLAHLLGVSVQQLEDEAGAFDRKSVAFLSEQRE